MTRANDRSARIGALEAEIKARGAAYQVDDGFDDEMLESFLEHILDFDDAPATTLRARLAAAGYVESNELWTLIRNLATVNVFLHNTNHVSDAELHGWLIRFMDEEVADVADMNMHIDVIGSGSDEDNALWLRHYATDDERNEWQRRFPDEQIPPRQLAQYDRDRFLPSPRRETPS